MSGAIVGMRQATRSRFRSIMIHLRCNNRHGILPSNHLIGAEKPDV